MSLWCAEQLIVTLRRPDLVGPERIVVRQPFARVGSHPEAEICIRDDSVAVRSLYLHATEAGVYCVELDMPGTEQQLRGHWLDPGYEVVVGKVRLQARLQDRPLAAPLSENLIEKGNLTPPQPVLAVYSGGILKDRRFLRSIVQIVGRRPHCSPRLQGSKVSGFHCALYWDGKRLWCIDLNSSSGTLLAGEPITASELAIGQQVGVGEFEIEFQRISKTGGRGAVRDPASAADSRPDSPSNQPEAAEVALALNVPGRDDSQVRSQWTEEVNRLKDEHAQELARHEQRAAELGSQVLEFQRDLREMAARVTEEAQIRTQWTAEVQSLKQSHADELARHSAVRRQLESEIAELRQLAGQPTNEDLRAQWTAEVQSLQQEHARASARQEGVRRQLESQIVDLQAKLRQLAADFASESQSRVQWDEEVNTLKRSHADELARQGQFRSQLESEIARLGANEAKLRKEADAQRTEVTSALQEEQARELARHEGIRSQLESQVAELQAELRQMESRVAGEERSRTQLNAELETLRQGHASESQCQEEAHRRRLQAQLAELESANAAAAERVTTLEVAQRRWEKEQQALRAALDERSQEISGLRAELTALHGNAAIADYGPLDLAEPLKATLHHEIGGLVQAQTPAAAAHSGNPTTPPNHGTFKPDQTSSEEALDDTLVSLVTGPECSAPVCDANSPTSDESTAERDDPAWPSSFGAPVSERSQQSVERVGPSSVEVAEIDVADDEGDNARTYDAEVLDVANRLAQLGGNDRTWRVWWWGIGLLGLGLAIAGSLAAYRWLF